MDISQLKQTPLYDAHVNAGAKIVDFAGYAMPLQFSGILDEHHHVRSGLAGLFDVSHMGQIHISGDNISRNLENFFPCVVADIPAEKCKYSFLMNEAGGVIDDVIISKHKNGDVSLVVNGARKHIVFDYLSQYAPENIQIYWSKNKSLIALQGAKAFQVLASFCPHIANLSFMSFTTCAFEGQEITVSRSGYTGEDGFEISYIPYEGQDFEKDLYNILLKNAFVKPIGLGARDSLRLEAGLPLYGQDLTETITPIEAKLVWAISKEKTKNHGYTGSQVLQEQLEQGTQTVRVGLCPEGKAIIRQGVKLYNADDEEIGEVCSGGFSPVLNAPIAMAYVKTEYAVIEQTIFALLRGKKIPVQIVKMPFVPHQYIR